MDILRKDDAMIRGMQDSARALADWRTRVESGTDPLRFVEAAYRVTRLRIEAEDGQLARLVAGHPRRGSMRLRLGRALMTFGRFVEGTGAQETDCASPVQA